MDYRQLFRQMGFISRQAMMKMNQKASNYGLDNNLFLLLIRIVENEGLSQSQLAELVQIDKTTLSRSLGKLEDRGLSICTSSASCDWLRPSFSTMRMRSRNKLLSRP